LGGSACGGVSAHDGVGTAEGSLVGLYSYNLSSVESELVSEFVDNSGEVLVMLDESVNIVGVVVGPASASLGGVEDEGFVIDLVGLLPDSEVFSFFVVQYYYSEFDIVENVDESVLIR
jgi:hypothetical protein